jgi:hypothetical protein
MTRSPGKPPLADDIKAEVAAKTETEVSPGVMHWSVRSMAKPMGIWHTSVQRIWREASSPISSGASISGTIPSSRRVSSASSGSA